MTTTKSLQDLALSFVDSRDERAFTLLHNRLKPGLKKHIQRYHQDPDVVEEILAITLSKAFIYVDKYDSRWHFSTWIYKICINECLMELRRQKALTSFDGIIETKSSVNAVNPDDWKIDHEYEFFENEEIVQPESLYAEVLEEIKNLDPIYREIIEDRILRKMKYTEIAEKRGLKINTVRSRIHSAKKVIKHVWIEKKRKTTNKNINILGVAVLKMLDEKKSSKKVEEPEKKIQETSSFITSARYGSGETWVEVTERVQKIYNEKGSVKSCNKLGGDPCYGVPKVLLINYTLEGKDYILEIKEGKLFSL
jgi:RNA polymerase sigma-70 factor (ECF subfamily)